mgnify:CR=1 FL=1
MGLDFERLLDCVEEMAHACAGSVPAAENPGVVLGAILGTLGRAGRDKVTLVASPGRGVLVCDLGNPGLATAGTGDVLTGIVVSFLSKGMDAKVAAAAAAAAGGEAARLAGELHGTAGMIASDVVDALSRALSR